jgi:phospholipid/cholesterol/gamma-HCH transport system substrate-binding protein
MSQLMNSGKELISKTGQLEEDADRLLKTLNRLLDAQTTQRITRLVENMERSSAALEPLLHSSQRLTDKAGRLLEEIHPHELSATLESVRQTSASIRETSDTARPALNKLQQSLDEFEHIGRHIEQVSTELGDTLKDETLPEAHDLARQLHRDAESLNRLIDMLEQNPQSVVFGKPQAAPGPGEKGFQP